MNLFIYNTDGKAGNDLDRCRRLLKHRIAATSGPDRFGERLRQLKPDDAILMYANGYGIIAAGIVLKEWDGKPHKHPKYYTGLGVGDKGEYRIPVNWTDDWIDDPIPISELQAATGNGFVPRGAVRKQVKHRLAIEQLVASRYCRAVRAPKAMDLAQPPPQVKVTINRIVRDTALACSIKQLHAYRCQLCGTRIKLRDGGYYAESHHIRPLGKDHQGLDIAENVICVCPNHHAQLDYGAIRLSTSAIRQFGKGHTIGSEYIDYHNSTIYGQ
jgi:hypothetical protein